jgi:peptidoglycan/LPS O-acetylase OafA/YrhL
MTPGLFAAIAAGAAALALWDIARWWRERSVWALGRVILTLGAAAWAAASAAGRPLVAQIGYVVALIGVVVTLGAGVAERRREPPAPRPSPADERTGGPADRS